MKNRSCILVIILFLFVTENFCQQNQTIDDKWKQLFSDVANTAQSSWDGVVKFAKGMTQMVGVVSSDYKYSLRVWNDAPDPIAVVLQNARPVMGAEFYGTVENENHKELKPFDNTGNYFYNKQLYVVVWILYDKGSKAAYTYAKSAQEAAIWGAVAGAVVGAGVFSYITAPLAAAIGGIIGGTVTYEKLQEYALLERDIYPWSPNDPYIYHYRAYSNHGEMKGEYLDIKGTTSEFLGTFYNNTDVNDITLTFSKDGKTYTVGLEPQSFSLLQSSSNVQYSIRSNPSEENGRAFIFKQGNTIIGYIPIPSEGVANVSCDENTKQCSPIAPLMYTYEVFKKDNTIGVGLQGLAIGNYDQPTNGRVRDINPVPCHFWYQSAEQYKKLLVQEQKDQKPNYGSIPFDSAETLWLYYSTKDSQFMQIVKPGSVLDFFLIRPRIQENQAWLYGVLLNSTDEKKAKVFFERLSTGKIAQKAFVSMTATQLEAGTISPNVNGLIDDTGTGGSGLMGYIVFADRFDPRGVGLDTFYYYLEPAQLQIDQYAGNILFDGKYYVKDSAGNVVPSDTVMQELITNIPKWIENYQKNKSQTEQEITKYLTERSALALFETGGQNKLTNIGKLFFNLFISGPISIANPPLLRKSGVNYYAFSLGGKPSNWPS